MITIIPLIKTQTFKGIPEIELITEADARICDAVKQNNDNTFKIAVKGLEKLPKRRFTTSGIVTAIVLRILGERYDKGIIAIAAAKTYQEAFSI